MKKLLLPTIAIAVALSLPATQVLAGPRNEQGKARSDLRNGNVKSLSEIERAVLPTMPGAQYLGPEYDPVAQAYRLKFIRNGRVIFIDVDARSGEVIRKLQ
jgi:hypothetical protein